MTTQDNYKIGEIRQLIEVWKQSATLTKGYSDKINRRMQDLHNNGDGLSINALAQKLEMNWGTVKKRLNNKTKDEPL